MRRVCWLMPALLLLGVGSCKRADKFTCELDIDCGQAGRCIVPENVCAFPDAACESEWKFGEHSGNVAGECVPPDGGTGSGTAGSTSTGSGSTGVSTGTGTGTGAGSTTGTGSTGDTGTSTGTAGTSGTGDTGEMCGTGPNIQIAQAAYAQLAVYQPTCIDENGPINDCLSAVSEYCANIDPCYAAGAGPINSGPGIVDVICLRQGDGLEVQNVTTAQLAATGVSLSNIGPDTRHAQAASKRYCVQQGFASGIGPVRLEGENATIVCLDATRAALFTVTNPDLGAAGCPSPSAPHTIACSTAVHGICMKDLSYQAGYGPNEFGASAGITCFTP